MKKHLLALFVAFACTLSATAQRTTDALDRGLVAVSTGNGVFCSWRIQADEYYDVTYNIYRNGTKLNDEPLTVSNYHDRSGSTRSSYTVEAVVRGVAQGQSEAVTPWSTFYKELTMDHGSLTSTYVPNDACCADVDGDGEVEILLKFDNQSDAEAGYLPGGYNGEYAIIEVYKLDGTKLWWIDLGPNMTDFQNNENNIVAYDWDQDGRAEAVLRASDGTVVHPAVGEPYTIGDASVNERPAGPNTQTNFFVNAGGEYLLYLNGATGEAYQTMDYPLPRFEEGEYNNSLDYGTNLSNQWGDGYGHRSTKHFFGAPYLDGRRPSIFIARGIYTRHKMVAYDVDPATHRLVERWRWNCNSPGTPWYSQGYHNYSIADVDWDGRDEICFGSMVIDDCGRGLSTSGLGHGDAMHIGDFDPYTPGQEFFGCNEEHPGNNLRNATTSEIYYRSTASEDDGRAVMGNFMDDVPGAVGVSAMDVNVVGAVARAGVKLRADVNMSQNFRIYWDGDLCEEMFDSRNGRNTNGRVAKPDGTVVADLTGSLTNNDTKSTPCYLGDILGDWREEVIMRTSNNNIRIYTTDIATQWRVPSLWYDHQYRQAMVWQMCGYNQPPHVSYYLGQLEGITVAPPPLTMTGRTEIANGSTISSSHNDAYIIMCETADMTVNVASGAQPYIFVDNAPTWVQGHDDNALIDTTAYTHTLTGAAFTGQMRLVKQGDGVLQLPNVTQTYTGPTDVWAGTLRFDGTMQSSRLWLNRHTTLLSNGGTFSGSIEADYNARIIPGGERSLGSVTTDSLLLNFGSVLVLDLVSDGLSADKVNANVLRIGTVDWQFGPKYSTPVIRFVPNSANLKVADGKYALGTIGRIEGSLSDLVVEGLRGQRGTLSHENGTLYVTIETYAATNVTWTGSLGNAWDLELTDNFRIDATGEERAFIDGDAVTFGDQASTGNVVVGEGVSPASVTFDNSTLDYTISGNGFLGQATLVKDGSASVTINSANNLASATINEGTVYVSSLANADDVALGALGDHDTPIYINGNSVLGITANTATTQPITVGEGGATFDVANSTTFVLDAALSSTAGTATTVNKTGRGAMTLGNVGNIDRLNIAAGSVNTVESDGIAQLPATVEFVAGQLWDYTPADDSTAAMVTNAANLYVAEGNNASLFTGSTTAYTGTLTGAGRIVAYAGGWRTTLQGDWSQFEGSIVASNYQRGNTSPVFLFDNDHGLPNASLEVLEGVTIDNCGRDVAIHSLSLAGTLTGSGTYILGGDDADMLYNGAIASPVRKIGAGRWSIYNTSHYGDIPSVSVDGGSLYFRALSAPATSMLGSGTITVNDGGSIVGTGTVTTLQVNSGGVITPGQPTSTDPYGCISATNAIVCAEGSVVNLNIRNAGTSNSSRSRLLSDGTIQLSGTLNITLSDSYQPASGDSIVLWQCAEFSGTPVVSLPALPSGLYWIDSDLLAATGVLRIGGTADGIAQIALGEAVQCRLYSVSGLLMGEFDSTMGQTAADAQSMAVPAGTYILRINGAKATITQKIVVK